MWGCWLNGEKVKEGEAGDVDVVCVCARERGRRRDGRRGRSRDRKQKSTKREKIGENRYRKREKY